MRYLERPPKRRSFCCYGGRLVRLAACPVVAPLGPREMSDLSPHSGPKRTLIRPLSPIVDFMSTHSSAATNRKTKIPRAPREFLSQRYFWHGLLRDQGAAGPSGPGGVHPKPAGSPPWCRLLQPRATPAKFDTEKHRNRECRSEECQQHRGLAIVTTACTGSARAALIHGEHRAPPHANQIA